jgi:hypothetical protein
MKLNFGFEDYPYSVLGTAKSPLAKYSVYKKRRYSKRYGENKTTGEVAQELEEKYGILDMFFEMEEDNIDDIIEDTFFEYAENVMMMQDYDKHALHERVAKLENKFKYALSNRRFDGRITGAPTKASLKEGRASFIKSGLYRQSFRAWVDDSEE